MKVSNERRAPVLGALAAATAVERLRALGDRSAADAAKRAMRAAGKSAGRRSYRRLLWGKVGPPAYAFTTHAVGYLSPSGEGPAGEAAAAGPEADSGKSGGARARGRAQGGAIPILDASSVAADPSLRGARLTITLDRLRVFDYPGGGEHTILFDVAARHAAPGNDQEARFAQTYRVREGSGAGVAGYPLFTGLGVGAEGLALRGYTVNVSNRDDKRVLSFLGNDVFRKGLHLVEGVNPVVPIVAAFATGITEMIAKRTENVPVQDFFVGLDLSAVRTRPKLREGSYVVAQVPDEAWDWGEWVYRETSGRVTARDDAARGMPYNYMILGVSRSSGAAAW